MYSLSIYLLLPSNRAFSNNSASSTQRNKSTAPPLLLPAHSYAQSAPYALLLLDAALFLGIQATLIQLLSLHSMKNLPLCFRVFPFSCRPTNHLGQDPVPVVLAVCDAAAAKIGPPVRGAEPAWSCVEALRAAASSKGGHGLAAGMAKEGELFTRVSVNTTSAN